MAVNDIYRVEVFQNVGSELTMNVMHFREVVAETMLPIPALNLVEISGLIYSDIAQNLSEDWRVTQINARRVSSGPGVPASQVFGGTESIVGEITSQIVPSQAAILISLYTSNQGRSGRGRIYLPGCPESGQNEGQLTETYWIGLNASLALLTQQLSGTGGDGEYRLCVFGGGASPTSEQDVIHTVTRTNLATQRRRRNFPGFGAAV